MKKMIEIPGKWVVVVANGEDDLEINVDAETEAEAISAGMEKVSEWGGWEAKSAMPLQLMATAIADN